MIISKTPFRVSFFGGGTDYPVYYKEHGGSVISTSINNYCYIQVRHLPSVFAHRYRIVYSDKEDVDTLEDIKHNSVRECLKFMNMDTRIEIVHTSDIPSMTGLASSSAFTVGLLKALYGLKGKMVSKYRLAMDAIYVEQEMIKESVGSQDQTIAAFGGFNRIDFKENGGISVNPITTYKKIKDLENHLMLFYIPRSITASDIAKEQINNMSNKEKEMKRMVEMVDEAIDIINDNNNNWINDFGELLHESWMIKRTLSNKITTPYIDGIYYNALKAGAIGGKLSGAGGGGSMLLVVKPENQKNVRHALKNITELSFKFSNEGSSLIYYDE